MTASGAGGRLTTALTTASSDLATDGRVSLVQSSFDPRPPERTAPFAVTWLGVMWASLLGEFFATVYCDSLLVLAPQPSLLLLGLLLVPGLLAVPAVRTISHRAPLFALCAGLVPWVEPVAVRGALLGTGLAGVSLGLLAAAMTQPRAVAGAWLAGVVLSFALRSCCGSVDPLASEPWLAVASAVATGWAGFVGQPGARTATAVGGRALPGVPFGAASFLVHGWFLGPTVIARWAGLGSETGVMVVLAVVAGLVLMPMGSVVAWASVAGMALLAVANGAAALAGGCLVAVALPSLWSDALVRLAKAGPRAVVAAAITHLALFLLQAAAFASDYVVGTSCWPQWLAAIAILTAVLTAAPAFGHGTGTAGGLRRQRLVVATIAMLLAAIGSLPVSTNPAGDRDLAMTWNLQQGFSTGGRLNLRDVASAVRAEGVTLLCLQEADATRPTSAGRDLVAWLAADLGMHAVCGPGPKQATFGLAVLSSHPILASCSLLVPSAGDHAVLLLATVDVRGQPLHVAVTHFGGAAEYRESQACAVGHALAVVSGPLLLLGDFNLAGDAPSIARLLREGRLQATATSQEPTHAAGPVDHAFFRDLQCEPSRVPDTGGISDHRPLVVPFSVRRRSRR